MTLDRFTRARENDAMEREQQVPPAYTVAPDVAAIVVEAGRQLGAPIRKDARSPAAFDVALGRLIRLAHTECVLHKYEGVEA